MVNFRESEIAFKEYLKDYDMLDEKNRLKVKHTYGVVKASEYIARELGLDDKSIRLSKLIALLHDIGRFEQLKITQDFNDSKGFNHAKHGVEILFEDGLIRKFIKSDKYDSIIYKSILNHNKYEIGDDLNENELLYAKLIRDADKLDNFRVKETEKLVNMFPKEYNPKTIEYEKITDKIFKDFMDHKTIVSSENKTQIDIWISYIAMIFDLNFNISLKYVKDKNYVDILIDRIEYRNEETKKKIEIMRDCVKQYLEENVNL